jgi:hypothetical protein
MPEGFTLFGEKTDFLIPYGWTLAELRETAGRGSSFGLARLRDYVSFAQAESDMKSLMALREKENPRLNTGWSITLVPAHEQMVDQIRPALQVLAGAVLFVWLVACVNVANCCWRVAPFASASSDSAPHSAQDALASCLRCLPRACCSVSSAEWPGSPWRSYSIAGCSRSLPTDSPFPGWSK